MKILTMLSSILLLGALVYADETPNENIDEQMLSDVRSECFMRVYEEHGKAIKRSIMLRNCKEKELAEMTDVSSDTIAGTIIKYLLDIKINPQHKYYPLISKMSSYDLYYKIGKDINENVNGYKIGFKEGFGLAKANNTAGFCSVVKEDAIKSLYKNTNKTKVKTSEL